MSISKLRGAHAATLIASISKGNRMKLECSIYTVSESHMSSFVVLSYVLSYYSYVEKMPIAYVQKKEILN